MSGQRNIATLPLAYSHRAGREQGPPASDQQSEAERWRCATACPRGMYDPYVPEALNRGHPCGAPLRLGRMFITAGLAIDFRRTSKALPRG